MSLLQDGFSTKISFALNPSIAIEEVAVTPPAVQAGGPIDTTTMRNTEYRTAAPKSLKSLGDGKATVAYDASDRPAIDAMIGQNQLITWTYPDDSTMEAWGWLDSFVPGELKEGTRPTAAITIVHSNRNNSGVETAPVEA